MKADFFRSRSLSKCSVGARLTFIGLWTEADDRGRGVAEPRVLKGSIWPLDDDVTPAVIASHLCELAETNHIRLYTHDEDVFYSVRAWEKHQAAAYRRGEPKYPDPDDPAVCTILHAGECKSVPSFGFSVGLEEALAAETSVPVDPPAVDNHADAADADDFDRAITAAVEIRRQRTDNITNLERWAKAARNGVTKDYGFRIRQLLDQGHDPTSAAGVALGVLPAGTRPAAGHTPAADDRHANTCVCDGSGWVQVDEDDEGRAAYVTPCTAPQPTATVLPMRGAS